MIKSFTAVTKEIDDEKLAIKEILEGLAPEKNLLKNSVGIISCFSEFADTGVLKAVCDALPFDCVGTTTCLSSCSGETDQLMLAITVLTSDDCMFDALSLEIDNSFDKNIDVLMKDYLKKVQKPQLFLSFVPLINTISGDVILKALDNSSGGIPMFGTVAMDHNEDYSTSRIIFNGEAGRNTLSLVGIRGNVKCAFSIAALNENRIRKQKAIITASNGNILVGVNGISAVDYLESLGLTREEIATGIGVLPLIIDHRVGAKPVARAVFALTDEGHAVCGGEMPINATLSVGHVNRDDVLQTTEQCIKDIDDGESVILCFSCIARNMVLGIDTTAEADKVSSVLSSNYMFTVSGGEVCPLPDADGNLKNFFHNYTVVVCKLS